jgi:hypothetical protein
MRTLILAAVLLAGCATSGQPPNFIEIAADECAALGIARGSTQHQQCLMARYRDLDAQYEARRQAAIGYLLNTSPRPAAPAGVTYCNTYRSNVAPYAGGNIVCTTR